MAEVQTRHDRFDGGHVRFLDMVGLFGTQAMIALGKLANPATGKAEKNMAAARLFIDTLEMLEHKTRGNLNSDETKVLQATLTDLRLMFVEESKAPQTTSATSGTRQADGRRGGGPEGQVSQDLRVSRFPAGDPKTTTARSRSRITAPTVRP